MNSSTRYELVTRLNGDPQFSALKSNNERIAYLLKNAYTFEQLKEMLQVNLAKAWDSSRKSPSLATRYYQEADTCFKTDRYDAALSAVHKAILHTFPHQIAFLLRLYALKWKIHFRSKEYQAMLYSAEICFDLQPTFEYLKMKIQSLALLRQFSTAIELINKVTDHQVDGFSLENKKQLAKLVALKNEMLEFKKVEKEGQFCVKPAEPYFSHKLAPSVAIVNSPVVGRHFVATQSIPKDVVLLRERPYSLVLELDYWKTKCGNCNHNLEHKYFPW